MDVGERIRARREELGLTQAQLADELGVTHQHVSGVESGVSAPSLDLLVRIARRLGVSTDFLLTGESQPPAGVCPGSPPKKGIVMTIAPEKTEQPATKRTYVSQSDIPRCSLEDALRVARGIASEYGKQPTSPVDVATALHLIPTGGQFKRMTGAAVAYGVTEDGAQAPLISLTDLGRRIIAPTEEGDDVRAMREAFLRPRITSEFLRSTTARPCRQTR